jgi:hypothetical protein
MTHELVVFLKREAERDGVAATYRSMTMRELTEWVRGKLPDSQHSKYIAERFFRSMVCGG